MRTTEGLEPRKTQPRRRRAFGVAAVALAATAILAACDPPKPPNDCPEIAGLDKWTWVGAAADDVTNVALWHHPGNDGTYGYPGARNAPADAADDYVCVPDDRALTVRDGQSMHIQVLDNRGIVEITPGGKLDLEGNDTDRTSTSNVLVLKGLLAGPGTLTTAPGGLLWWVKTPSGGTAMRTDEAPPFAPSPLSAPAKTVISAGATLRIESGGVQLSDRRTIENLGTTQISGGSAYLALDDGTTFHNLGTVDFLGDGDIYQGVIDASPPPSFVNEGVVRKLSGSGLTIFDVPYTRIAPGSVQVSTGRLSVWNDTTVTATVDPGATLATGGCGGGQLTCAALATTPAQPQFATLRRAAGAGTSAAAVTIAEGAPEPGDRGNAINLTAPPGGATLANPMVLTIAVDRTLLLVGDTAANLDVSHDDSPPLPDCPLSGTVAGGCVDRAASTGGPTDDVVMVIRTATNSRWRLL